MRRGPCVHGKTRQLRRRRWGEKSILRRSLLNGQWLRLLSWHNRYCGEADYICNDDPLHSHVLRIRGLRPIFTHVTLFLLSMCKRSIPCIGRVWFNSFSDVVYIESMNAMNEKVLEYIYSSFLKHFLCRPSFVSLNPFIFILFSRPVLISTDFCWYLPGSNVSNKIAINSR